MTATTALLYCANHPARETTLRCNRCEKPICVSCAVRTPTGYRCKDCVRGQQKIFETAQWHDYLLGFATTAVLSLITSGIIAIVSFFAGFLMWFLSFAIAAGAGSLIAKTVLAVLRRHRSKPLFFITAAGVVSGALPVIFFLLFTGDFYAMIWQGIFVFTATPTVFYRVSGIHL